MAAKKVTLEHPPFPKLQWDGSDWNASVVLSAWAGFQSRQGAYASRNAKAPSKGLVNIRVRSPEEEQPLPPTAAQVKAFQQLLDQQIQVRDALLKGLLKYYAEIRPRYADFLGEEFEQLMPKVKNASDFQHLIGLSNVFVLATERQGLAYLGFELGCTWDVEHGLGFLLHGTRVVDVGGADTAFLGWNAEQDAEE